MLHLYSHHIHVTFRIPLIHYPLFTFLSRYVCMYASVWRVYVYVSVCRRGAFYLSASLSCVYVCTSRVCVLCLYVVCVCVCVCTCTWICLLMKSEMLFCSFLISTQTTSTALCIVHSQPLGGGIRTDRNSRPSHLAAVCIPEVI